MRRFYIEEKWKKRAATAAVMIILGFCYFYHFTGERNEKQIHSDYAEEESVKLSESRWDREKESAEESICIAVHVSGAVQYPDQVYYLAPGARLEEAIKAAGGATAEADLSLVNLAALVKDGQKIKVPAWGEEAEGDSENPAENGETLLTNINLATKIELQKLPGIGEAYAERILEYRTRQGGFQKIEDIMNVKGIGKKVFENIKELITVN